VEAEVGSLAALLSCQAVCHRILILEINYTTLNFVHVFPVRFYILLHAVRKAVSPARH
jgi:hypothetical protein